MPLTPLARRLATALSLKGEGRNGFTLIELLIALGLSAAILAAIYSMLVLGARTWTRMRQQADLYQAGRAVFNRMQADLEAAMPVPGGALRDFFKVEATEAQLGFPALVSVSPVSPSVPDHQAVGWIRYRWSEGMLERRWTAYPPQAQPSWKTTGTERFPAMVTRVRFAYPYRNQPSVEPAIVWDAAWGAPDRLPESVQVDVSLKHPETGQELALRKIFRVWPGQLTVRTVS